MDVQFTPEMQARLDQLAMDTGRPHQEFVREAVAGYLDEMAELRETLDRRYDDIESGRVQMVSKEEMLERLRARSAAFRQAQAQRTPDR